MVISDEMLAEAAAEVNAAMLRCLPDPNQCSHHFSKGFERKIRRLIRKAKHPVIYRVTQQAAAFVLILFISFMTLLAISPTVRAAVFGWIRDQYAHFTQYYFSGSVSQDNGDVKYELTYLPDGYEEIRRNDTPSKKIVYYENKETGKILLFVHSNNPESIIYYVKSSEYALEEILIHNRSADFYQAPDASMANAVFWSDSSQTTSFCVSAFAEKEELRKIAENIKIF